MQQQNHCRSPALGAIAGGLQGSIAAGAPLLQNCTAIYGRTSQLWPQCRSPALGAIAGGLLGPIAAGAPLPQKHAFTAINRPFKG